MDDVMLWDVIVVGAGPAGMVMARALLECGLKVAVVSPEWPAPWPNNYGVWLDEVAHIPWLEASIERRWTAPAVRFHDATPLQALARTYVRLDNARMRADLMKRCAQAHPIQGTARRAQPLPHGMRLWLEDGRTFEAKLLLDATGHRPALVRRESPDRPGVQVAYGVMIDDPGPQVLPQDMVLMDFESPGPAYDRGPSTFLYAMRLGQGRALLEETSLSGRPGLEIDDLERRLRVRMRRRGLELEGAQLHEVERCFIPMGGALPILGQRVVGYGGAASMVQPISGYHMARVLGWAPDVARAIASATSQGPEAMSRAGWGALWTPDRLRQRELYLYGLEMLLDFDARRTQAFFERFFELPLAQWSSYLSGANSSAELAATMLRLFGRVEGSMRLELMRPALGRAGGHLMRALLPGRHRRTR